MLPTPAGPQWDELSDFLDLASGFALAILIFPSQPHAEHWKKAIAAHLAKNQRTLESLGPFDSTNVHRVAEHLCYEEPPGNPAPLWLPLCQPPMAPDAAAWPEALRRALVGLNQTRNLITQRHPRILILAGTHELLETAPRIAPDLWSIRRVVMSISETEAEAFGNEKSEVAPAESYQVFTDARFLPTLAEVQALLIKSQSEGNILGELRALNALVQIHASTHNIAERDEAVERLIQVATKASETDGTPQLSIHLTNAAETLRELAHFDVAERLLRRALEIEEQRKDTSNPRIAVALGNLGTLLFTVNKLAEAESLTRRALALDEQMLGPMHPNLARSLNNLATIFQATNRIDQAEPLMRKALEIDRVMYGPHHPTVAMRLSNLGTLLLSLGRFDEAEQAMRNAVQISEATFGTEHPDVAMRLSNLGQLLQASNRMDEAEPFMRRALYIDERCFGSNHPDVARDLNNLARLLQETNRVAEAIPLIQRSLEISEKTFGPLSPEVATRLNNLGGMLSDLGRVDEAEAMMRRALEIDEKSLGSRHPKVAIRLSNLAQLLQETDRPAEAETLMRRAVSVDEKNFPAFHPQVAIRRYNLAHMLVEQGRFAEAESLAKASLEILLRFFRTSGTVHPRMGIILRAYSDIRSRLDVSEAQFWPELFKTFADSGVSRPDTERILSDVFGIDAPIAKP